MSYLKRNTDQVLEKIYVVNNFNLATLVAASTESTLFTTDANKGIALVHSVMFRFVTYTSGTPALRIGTPGSRNSISATLTITPVVNRVYCPTITYPHTVSLAPSTNIIISNNFISSATTGTIDVYIKVCYFGTS